VLRDIRAGKAELPVLILTAKSSLEERVTGLDSGADDYMVKPFALAELSARLRDTNALKCVFLTNNASALVSRSCQRWPAVTARHDLVAAMPRCALLRRGKPRETRLNVADLVMDIVRRIDREFSPPLIHTVRGVGYMLTDKPP
jgi:DNA-binding response OmpR family regulator